MIDFPLIGIEFRNRNQTAACERNPRIDCAVPITPRFCSTLILFAALAVLSAPADAQSPATETIVMIRHGEKPPGGQGRLDCRGLSRANELPATLAKEFGQFDAIFAPDPDQLKKDGGVRYRYTRPLETVSPLSKASGVPVDLRFGYKQIEDLEAELLEPKHQRDTILVAWEHKKLVKLARSLLKNNGGDARQAGKWPGSDFDSIYVIQIVRDGASTIATFDHRSEGLDNHAKSGCP